MIGAMRKTIGNYFVREGGSAAGYTVGIHNKKEGYFSRPAYSQTYQNEEFAKTVYRNLATVTAIRRWIR